MKKFGKYTVSDHKNLYIIETEKVTLFIYKSMLNREARTIINNANSEEAITAFLRAYAEGLEEVVETVGYLIKL